MSDYAQAIIDSFHSEYAAEPWDYSEGLVSVRFTEDADLDAAAKLCEERLGNDGWGVNHLFGSGRWWIYCPLKIAAEILADEVKSMVERDDCFFGQAAEKALNAHKVHPMDATEDDRFLSDAAKQCAASLPQQVWWTNEACEALARLHWQELDLDSWESKCLAVLVFERDPMVSGGDREWASHRIKRLLQGAKEDCKTWDERFEIDQEFDRLCELAQSADFC